MPDLQNTMKEKVVVITGAGRGIGLGIVRCFHRKGAIVVIVDANGEAANSAATALIAEEGGSALGIACDITDASQIQRMIEEVISEFGRIDVLVNNAGICPFVDVMEMDVSTWQKTLDVNLTGAFNCTQAVAREMIRQQSGGRIIFITSLAENVTSPRQVDYAASKAGLRMTMAGFATALGQHGITCNAIAPGMIMTDMTRWSFENPEVAEAMKLRIPMGRVGTPEDIGHVAVFLASKEAEYVSGITIRVDGGHQAVCA